MVVNVHAEDGSWRNLVYRGEMAVTLFALSRSSPSTTTASTDAGRSTSGRKGERTSKPSSNARALQASLPRWPPDWASRSWPPSASVHGQNSGSLRS